MACFRPPGWKQLTRSWTWDGHCWSVTLYEVVWTRGAFLCAPHLVRQLCLPWSRGTVRHYGRHMGEEWAPEQKWAFGRMGKGSGYWSAIKHICSNKVISLWRTSGFNAFSFFSFSFFLFFLVIMGGTPQTISVPLRLIDLFRVLFLNQFWNLCFAREVSSSSNSFKLFKCNFHIIKKISLYL